MLNVVSKYIAKKYKVFKDFVTSLPSKLCFWKSKEEFIVAPCVGDVIEFEDGSRSIVMSVENKAGMYDVRFSKGLIDCVNNRGRRNFVSQVSSEAEMWPPENAYIFRDSYVIFPQKSWRVSLVVWFSKLILKK